MITPLIEAISILRTEIRIMKEISERHIPETGNYDDYSSKRLVGEKTIAKSAALVMETVLDRLEKI